MSQLLVLLLSVWIGTKSLKYAGYFFTVFLDRRSWEAVDSELRTTTPEYISWPRSSMGLFGVLLTLCALLDAVITSHYITVEWR